MSKIIKAVCYGEVLMDVFPDEERIGGAPLNVATRMSSLGVETQLISKVGDDYRGARILDFLDEKGVGSSNILKDPEYPTGIVKVDLSRSGSATYDIAYPAAWDKIEISNEAERGVKNSDIFIFGSLVCRDEVSRNTLFQLLPEASYKVLDFNLRPPHYTDQLLADLIQHADFIKFNDDELYEIAEILGSRHRSLEQNIRYIAQRSKATTICVTKGRHGAVLLRDGKFFYNSGYRIKVTDTVGAGDSFLGSLLAKLFHSEPVQDALDYACAIGALVAGEKGANPDLDPQQVLQFMDGQL